MKSLYTPMKTTFGGVPMGVPMPPTLAAARTHPHEHLDHRAAVTTLRTLATRHQP